MTRAFSTGSGELDRYLGGVRPGDTTLIIQSASRDAVPLLKSFADHCRALDHSLRYLRINGSLDLMLTGVRLRSVSPGRAGAQKSTGLHRWATSTVDAIAPGESVVLDDLSEWANRLGKAGLLLSLIQRLSKKVAQRKAFAFLTASRTGLSPAVLAGLKDIADVSLELSTQEGNLLLNVLHARGRLPSIVSSPFGFRLTRRRGRPGKHLSAIPDFHQGPGNMLRSRQEERERISELLIDGPLGLSGTGTLVADLSGTYRAANERLLKQLGLRGEDIGSVDVSGLVEPASRRALLRFIARARDGESAAAELVLVDTGGKRHPVLVRSDRIAAGLTVFYFNDDREREAASEADRTREIEHRLLFHDAPYALCIADAKRIYRFNSSFLRLRGVSGETGARGEGRSPTALRACFEPKFLRRLREAMSDPGPAGEREPVTIEGPLLRTDGTTLTVRVTLSSWGTAAPGMFRLLVENITPYTALISKLESSDRIFRGIAEQITGAVGLLRKDIVIYANGALCSLLGFEPPGEATGISLLDRAPESGRERLAEWLARPGGPGHQKWVTETELVRADSTVFPARVSFRRLSGLPEADMMVEIEDVSASKTEAARLTGMQRGAERVGEILEASTATLEEEKLLQVALDKTLDILEWSAGLIYKLDPASTTFSPALNRKVPRKLLSKLPAFTPDEGLGGFVMKTLESHIIDVDTYPSYLPLGTLFREQGIRQISLVPLVHGESPLGFILGLSDREGKGHPADTLTLLGRQLGNAIANARRLTDMKASEGQLHLVVSSLSGTVYTSGPEGLIRSIDQSVSRLLGYTSRDFGRNRSLFLSLIHEEDKKIYLERVTASQSLPSTFVRVYRMRPKAKAACVWVRDSVSVMRDGAGRVKGFTGLLSDVTGEREKFTAVQSERSVLRSVQDVIPDGIAAFDHEGKCVEWNPTMERITGRGRNDSAGRSVEELAFLPDGLTPGMLAGKSRAQQITVLGLTGTVTGNERRYEVTLVPVPGNRGEDPGFLLRYTDVTVREKEIHALLESEKILLNVINAMDDVMMITDLGGRIVEVNRAFLKCTGYSRSEVVGEQFPYRWLDEKDMGRFLQWISRIREQKWLHDFDLTWITKRGSKVQMSLNTTPIRNSSGEPVAMLNIARDITERVRLIGDLEARNIQIEMINRVVTLANLSNDFSEVFRTVAREVVRVVPSEWVLLLAGAGLNPSFSMIENFGPGRLQPGDFLPLAGIPDAAGTGVPAPGIIGDLRFETRAVIPESLAGQARSAVVVPLVMNGKIVGTFVAANREPHAYAEEHEALLVPLVRQIGGIIERIRLFRQVASDSTYVRALLDALDSPVYTVDLAHTIREINRAGISFLEELVGAGETVRAGANLFSILGDSPLGNTLRQGVEAGEYSAEIPVDSGSGAKIIRVTVNSLREGGGITGYVFSHTDITSLKTTENELRDRARQLITLHEISMLIANSYDINLVLSSALPLLKTAIDADAVLVYLAGQGSADLRLERQEGFLADDVAPISVLSPDRSITGDVVRRREANYIERDVQRDGRISHPNRIFLEKHGMQAMAIIPILVKEKVLGALDILYRAEHVFPEQEKHILNLVGNQIGAAIENVELYKELTAQVERLSILFELSRSLTSLLDTGQICRTAFEHVSRVAECERCTIGLLDGQSGKLTVKLRAEADGDLNRVGPGDGTGMDGSGVTDVIRGRTTYRSPDRTAVIVPMVSEGTITGVIEVVTGGRPLDEVQIRLLESVGSLTAIALEKGKLYEETVEKSGEIEQRNRELDDYTYVVSHDLKEPLISIEGFSRILQMDYSDVIREEGREYLDSLVGATTRMKGLIDDLLLLSRVSRPSESFRSVDISGIIEEIRTDMEFLIKKRNVSLVVSPGLPAVRGNETQLGILFRNLIGNAVKFNDKLRPEISIGFRIHENNSYLFWVKDNGIGIDQEFHDKIFVIFQRLHRREEFEGSGAGLAIVKKIIETHQGNIWVESVKGTGSTFLFTLPADTQA